MPYFYILFQTGLLPTATFNTEHIYDGKHLSFSYAGWKPTNNYRLFNNKMMLLGSNCLLKWLSKVKIENIFYFEIF